MKNIMVMQQFKIYKCAQCPFYAGNKIEEPSEDDFGFDGNGGDIDPTALTCEKTLKMISREESYKNIADFCPLIDGVVYFDEKSLKL